MVLRVLALLVGFAFASIGVAQEVDRSVTVSDGFDATTLHFGLDPFATDGIDAAIGEEELPPLPPLGVFEARFIDTDLTRSGLGQGVYKDYVAGSPAFNGSVEHELRYQVGTGTTITISWDLPEGTTGQLQDLFGGIVVDVPMSGTGNTVIDNPSGISKLIMTITYVPASPAVTISLFLQGPFSGGSMTTFLNSEGALPTAQPFSTLTGTPAFYDGGESVSRSFFEAHPEIVDWMLFELRATTAPESMMSRMAGFVTADGSCIGIDGNAPAFAGVADGEYYLVAFHRNHLAVMSSSLVDVVAGATASYDFTVASSAAFGSQPMAALGGGVFGLLAADANANGQIQNDDKNAVWALQVGNSGYLGSDFNLNTQVQNDDKNVFWNPNVGRGTQVP